MICAIVSLPFLQNPMLFRRPFFMLRKLTIIGFALFFCSACFPHTGFLPEKAFQKSQTPIHDGSSLFTPSELEEIFSSESSPAPVLVVSAESPSARSLDLPISDESNDDFSLEIVPEVRRSQAPTFDIPIVINGKVEQFIEFFKTTVRANFSSWLSRAGKYVPFMKNLLRENGLPEDLVYMALIESGFNPYAYSRSKASGPWQFISPTGKRYGLKVDGWVDERRDPEKSTVAASKYLKDLYDMFECWYLAAAGYNAGENRILNGMKRYRTEDFWELAKHRYLKQETKDYVPQMIAAALIAKDPEKHGFVGIVYQDPLRYEKVNVPRVTDLRGIARACGITVEKLKELNPELLRGFTPPGPEEYEINIPFGKKEIFLENFERDPKWDRFQFKVHVVKKKETLQRIAKSYGVKIESILEINQLNSKSGLSVGTNLLVPVPVRSGAKTASVSRKKSNS